MLLLYVQEKENRKKIYRFLIKFQFSLKFFIILWIYVSYLEYFIFSKNNLIFSVLIQS